MATAKKALKDWC